MMLTSKLANERNGHQFSVATFLIMSLRQYEPTDFSGAFEVVVNHYIDNREQVAQRRLALKLGCTCHTSSFYFLACYPLALEVESVFGHISAIVFATIFEGRAVGGCSLGMKGMGLEGLGVKRSGTKRQVQKLDTKKRSTRRMLWWSLQAGVPRKPETAGRAVSLTAC